MLPKNEVARDKHDPEADRAIADPTRKRRGTQGVMLGASILLLLAAGLAVGGWRHYQARRDVAMTAQQSRTFVPEVRVAAVRASDSKINVALPATTTAFEAANIFARASGYIEKR
ncbi:MAG TPA: efflux RND transporter periplasmic adaptor subunit, partial [Bradyrhizobium sp.]|nr:efflux RND transporter periplasmic adaptor subunit [Bradyrhizobium sp.]